MGATTQQNHSFHSYPICYFDGSSKEQIHHRIENNDQFYLPPHWLGGWGCSCPLLHLGMILKRRKHAFFTILRMFQCFCSRYFFSQFRRWRKHKFYLIHLHDYIDYLSLRHYRQFLFRLIPLVCAPANFRPFSSIKFIP